MANAEVEEAAKVDAPQTTVRVRVLAALGWPIAILIGGAWMFTNCGGQPGRADPAEIWETCRRSDVDESEKRAKLEALLAVGAATCPGAENLVGIVFESGPIAASPTAMNEFLARLSGKLEVYSYKSNVLRFAASERTKGDFTSIVKRALPAGGLLTILYTTPDGQLKFEEVSSP